MNRYITTWGRRAGLGLLTLALGWPGPAQAQEDRRAERGAARKQATVGNVAVGRERPRSPGLPNEPLGRPVAVGFSGEPLLREAIVGRLMVTGPGRYVVVSGPRIPAEPGGVLLGGFVTEQAVRDGWQQCRVRYFVVMQPGPVLRRVDSVAASVPALEDADDSAGACLEEAAAQIADGLAAPLSMSRGEAGRD